MSKYLDIEKLEYADKIIELDDEIAESILELNKKGYNTISSCSGHSNTEFYPFTAPLSDKERLVESGSIIYDESDVLYGVLPSTSTYCYIKFDRHYDFDVIPHGFEYESANEAYARYLEKIEKHPEYKNDNITFGDLISRRIGFMDENGKRKSKESIEIEIKQANIVLLEWVKQLESVKLITR